jgi:hypothetical protein
MNALRMTTPNTNELTLPEPNQMYVVVGGRSAADRLFDLAARLAVFGRLLLLDCGNRSNPTPIVRGLRRLTPDPARALHNIQTARAFTCYQVAALLEETASQPVQRPVMVLDLLATFYDESVSLREGSRLLDQALRCITQIHRQAPVLVSVRPPLAEYPERKAFLEKVCQLSDVLWVEEFPQAPQPEQLSFFF